MRTSTDIVQHAQKPEYRQALQELIKYELQALVERLSETGEEAVILTASLQNGTSTQLASSKAEGFLIKQKTLGSEFLNFFNDGGNSSGDDLCTFEEASSSLIPKLNTTAQYEASNDRVLAKKEKSPASRLRERTTPRRLSLSREDKKSGDLYEVSQTSDLSASERNDSASSVSSFVEAHEQDSNVNRLQCKICVRTFRSFKALNLHIRKHMVKSYKCNFCGKIFSLKSSYQRHIKSHKKCKVFECGFCDESFADQLSWKQHRERHFGARNFSCNVCGKAFYEKYSLKVHQTSHFIPTQKTDRNMDSNTGYSCHICQKFSKTKAALKNHILTHSAKKHACEFCNKRFSLKYSYIRHRRIHTGEKPYKCCSCGKQFSDSSAWAKHIRTHSGIKPYSCDFCDKSFYDKTSCKTHLKIHKNKMGRQIQPEKRNFEIMSDKTVNEDYSENLLKDSLKAPVDVERKYDPLTGDNGLHAQPALPLKDHVAEFNNSSLLDSGFDQDLMVKGDEELSEHVLEHTLSPILDSVDLDEKFQKEFVERNMPMKAIESDNELISTNFPDEAEYLDENDSENHSFSNKKSNTFDLQTSQNNCSETSNDHIPSLVRKSTRRRGNKRSGKWFPDSPSKCKRCQKVFKQDSLLKQHLQFHCMLKLYKCRYCGKQLSTQHSLVRHERIHAGERPYQCYLCQKTFPDNYGCIRHVKTHFTNETKGPTPLRNVRSSMKTSCHESSMPSSAGENVNSDILDLGVNTFSVFQEANCQNLTESISLEDKSEMVGLEPTKSKAETLSKSHPLPHCGVLCGSNKQEQKRPLFRCYNCSALFPTQQDCVDHIQRECNKNVKSEFISVPHGSNGNQIKQDNQQIKSLYQCSVCKMMFNEEDACRAHQVNGCQGEYTTQSILQETSAYVSPSKNDLPSLPFPDVSSEHSLLDINEDVTFLSDEFPCSITSDNQIRRKDPVENQSCLDTENAPFLIFDPTQSCASSSMSLTSTKSLDMKAATAEVTFTAIVPKPANVSQGKYLITNQGLSLLSAPPIGPAVTTPPETTANCEMEPLLCGKSDLVLKTSIKPNIEERTCTLCNKVFTNKHILKQHLLIHLERKFGCKYCLKKFHNKYGRDRHERIHTGEKPYSCPKCRKAFSDNSTYRKHTRVCCSGK